MRTQLAFALLILASTAAKADTYQLFDLNATLANGGTITGTVNLNLDSTLYYSPDDQYANLVYTLNGTSTDIVGFNGSSGSNHLGPETTYDFYFGPLGTGFVLTLPTTTPFTLAGFAGGLCTGSCAAFNSSIVYNVTNTTQAFIWVTSGTFTPDGAPVSDIPEPSSLALLGTGLLGIIARLRRARHGH
ncbi:MAG TPA: PEP-CTERM sorting domain-containing protein [Acidobacteriaceae bacterium]|nr:PEP-CTERM sorting domain-containing protein [Acidobacteriaceae bacterium]